MRPADDLDRAVDSVVAALSPGTARDWQAPAGALAWPCRFTAEQAERESLSSAAVDPWTAIQWATGRISLPELPDVGSDWRWHSASLADR